MKTIQQNIDLASFMRDPYPTLAVLRRDATIAYVPELNAILMSKRDDIFICEKNKGYFLERTETNGYFTSKPLF
mgnify:CR=1 FL=1